MLGLVIRTQSGFYTVAAEGELFTCQLRGRFKKGRRTGDIIAVGDRVEFAAQGDKTGTIEVILPRQRMFSRLAPQPQGEYQQILIANPDQVILVFACAEPAPRLAMLDRFLVIAEKAAAPAVIVCNKVDLVGLEQARQIYAPYANLPYQVIFTSARAGLGVNELREVLRGKISLLTGPSGVGKSSLLNAIQPGLGLVIREVSESTNKGRHTTVVRELFALQDGGWVADTPGLKALALWDIEPEELDAYFPELNALVPDCQFNDCSHQHEPGCAVIRAVEAKSVDPQRYESYLRMRFGEEQNNNSEHNQQSVLE